MRWRSWRSWRRRGGIRRMFRRMGGKEKNPRQGDLEREGGADAGDWSQRKCKGAGCQ